jgi:hypothetical protein
MYPGEVIKEEIEYRGISCFFLVIQSTYTGEFPVRERETGISSVLILKIGGGLPSFSCFPQRNLLKN